MKVKPGYKLTEVGVIPDDWNPDYIENFAVITTGSKNTQDRVKDGQFPFFVRSQTVERINSYSFDGEAVLTAGDGVGTGKVFHYINGRFDVHQRVYRISDFSERVNGYFFYLYFSTHFYSRIMQMTAKSSVDSVRRDMISRMLVALPPTKGEQRAIAAALSDVDALLGGLDRLIAKKRDLKQAAMQQLLTGQTRLPGFHGEWEVKRLGDLASLSKGTQLHSSETDEDGRFAHLNGGITPSSYTHKSNTLGNTIAISEGGNSCGFVQFMTEPYWCGGHCYSVIPNGVDNMFLYHALKGQQHAIMGLRVGSGLPNVQKTALLDFKIELPATHPEQIAIAEVLTVLDAELAALEQRREKTRVLKQAMMQELLTGRTRLLGPVREEAAPC
jgi:type I restriction enzyme, S subunit